MNESARVIKPLSPATRVNFCNNTVINSRYTIWSFLPMNLFEQFRRPLNCYFLLVSVLQFVSIIAPVNPLSTLLPLLFAFSFTAAKEGYDDLKRHRQDAEYNSRLFQVLRDGQWRQIESMEICVGDVLWIPRDTELPCDMVAIDAPGPTVYIRTENLDGEMDLKPRDRINGLPTLPDDQLAAVDSQGRFREPHAGKDIASLVSHLLLTCPPPSASINSFDAKVEVEGSGIAQQRISLSSDHLLPQSCYLKNTGYLVGVVVYTGNETKCGMSKKPAPIKWAKIDRQISNYSKIIFCFQMSVGLIFGIVGFFEGKRIVDRHWYLSGGVEERAGSWIIYPLRFFLLTSVMIPISFKFVVDMSKYYMALALEWDMKMYDESRDLRMKVKNSAIVEDLAQIEYVLSDKTGTMTQNSMELMACSVAGKKHDVKSEAQQYLSTGEVPSDESWKEFLLSLAVCNSVEVDQKDSGEIIYESTSPDEEALCYAAAQMGVQLVRRSREALAVKFFGQVREFKIHFTFAFTSVRKCMSILIQEAKSDHVLMLSKGADDRLGEMLKERSIAAAPHGSGTAMHVTEFANTGLRTLVFGKRILAEKDVAEFKVKYDEAALLCEGRAQKQQQLQSTMECSLSLIGASAIEDKLQENVPQTIKALLEANVKVWMLTGDKIETAHQIALSCRLMHPRNSVIHVHGDDWQANFRNPITNRKSRRGSRIENIVYAPHPQGSHSSSDKDSNDSFIPSSLDQIPLASARSMSNHYGRDSDEESEECVMLVHGEAFEEIFKSPELTSRFLTVADQCKSVVCARVNPAQKAQITALVGSKGKMTLSIGDGGNDVAMIQEAHVGVGIMGKEGQQAARAADFAISQFQYLATLMFVHGHVSYRRTCYVVQYSFYKSMLIAFVQLVFNITNTLMSGVSFWNSFSLTMWNGCYTLPQTLFYTLDRNVPRPILAGTPALYRLSQASYGLNAKTFTAFIFRGVLQATVMLVMVYLALGPQFIANDGNVTGTIGTSFTTAYSAIIFLQMFTVIIESHSITWVNALGLFGMPLVYYFFTWIYNSIPRFQYYFVFNKTFDISFFLIMCIICAVLFIPHYIFRAIQLAVFPSAADSLRKAYILDSQRMERSILRHRRHTERGSATCAKQAHYRCLSCIASWIDSEHTELNRDPIDP